MRKLILFFLVTVLGITSVIGQNQQNSVNVLFIDGDVLEITDGDQVLLKESVILKDCTILNIDGTYQTMDGEQSRLRNGECIDMYGIVYRNENQYRYKIKKENKILTDTQVQDIYQNKYHFIKINGKVFRITNLFQKRTRKPITLRNNIIVDQYGIYRESGKEEVRLLEGECFNKAGIKFENMNEYRKIVVKNIKKSVEL